MLQQEEELAKQKQQQQQELQQQKQQQQQKQIQQQKMVIEQQQERLEQNKMEVEFSQQQHVRFEREPTEVDEEDSCPPDLEAVELQPQQVHQQPEPQQVHQAPPPPSVPQQQDPFAGLDPTSDLVRNLAIAIKTSMETYKGQGGTYEPSADELIDVLKNLENLAAQNPALYRAIVDQIKGNNEQAPQTNGHQEVMEHHEQQGFSEVDQQQQSVVYEEHYQESGEINGVEQVDHAAVMEHDQMPSVQVEQKSPEQIKQEQKEAKVQAEVDREHEENMRALREKKKREKEPPPPPKTITVMAGARNRPSWPIAPGIANANIPRVIELTSAGENDEELMKSRIEVAQAAGLKHVEVIHGDETFYPMPMKDYDYPWSGSLRPVSNKPMNKGRGGREDPEAGGSPWAGSLRHVDKNKMSKKKKKVNDDDMYGSAPWMGTLRHVKHENKVTASMPKPQFKRYPDEDAPNPFEGMGGRDAKPVWPLTPAAVLSQSEPGEEQEMRKHARQFEDVERITAGLRETRTVSSALLKALMPKLLKEHESKYEPLGHDETFKIMEEILAMQIGLNTTGMVEDNDEADQIIKAICHGEIDNKVYSQMADDLENAAQLKRKEQKTKKKKKKPKTGDAPKSASELESSSSANLVSSATEA